MALHRETETHLRTLHTDGTSTELGPEEVAFFKVETGIQDLEESRKHIIKVHRKAYKASTNSLARR